MDAKSRLFTALKVSLVASIGTLLLAVVANRSNLELGILIVGPIILLGGLILNIALCIVLVKEKILGKLLYGIISVGLFFFILSGIALFLKSLKILD